MTVCKTAFVLLSTLAASAAGEASGQLLKGTETSTGASGAVLEPVEVDPFSDVFEASSPNVQPAPAAAAPAPTPAPATTPAPAPPPAAAAEAPPRATGQGLYWGPYLRLSGLAVRDDSFGAVAEFAALVRLEGGLEVAPFGAAEGFAFEAGLGIGAQGNRSFDELEAQLVVTSLQVSALYRQPIFTYLAAYARVTGSANVAHLRFARGAFEKEVDQIAVDGAGAGTLGLEATIPLGYTPQGAAGRKVDNYLGFFFEAGYELHTDLDFDGARRDVDEDTEPARIPIASEPLGELNLTGWTWRLGASFRF